ncbi:hypothetical protein KUCAC02_002477, partial [Chaenocephalus aceratus]
MRCAGDVTALTETTQVNPRQDMSDNERGLIYVFGLTSKICLCCGVGMAMSGERGMGMVL